MGIHTRSDFVLSFMNIQCNYSWFLWEKFEITKA